MQRASVEQQAYRWVICACSFVVLFVSNGMTLGGMAVFDIELMKSLGAITGSEISVTQIKLRDTIMFATASICGLGAGWLADKVGVKPMIIVGLALLAAGNFVYGSIQSLTQIYWIQAGFGVVLALCGLVLALRPDEEQLRVQSAGKLAFAVVVLLGYAYTLRPLGFLIPTAVASGLVSYQISPRATPALITGVGLSVGLFVLFKFVLGLGLFALPRTWFA